MKPALALSLCDIRVRHGAVVALDGVSLEVAAGEFMVLLGPSGCGKSTLLAAVCGLQDLVAGQVCLGSRDVTALEPAARNIAIVFQSYALYPTMTVARNITFGMRMRGLSRAAAAARLADVAQLLQLESVLGRKPAQLSGGQRQRVAIGRALVRDPDLFLFDEPLSNLDAKLRQELRAEIRLLHRRIGATVLYVTHDQVEAMTMADRIAVMRDGRIEQVGDPRAIYDRPENLFVAGFVGSPGMNLISGHIVLRNGVPAFAAGDAVVPLGDYAWLEQPVAGRPVVLGLRPEDIAVAEGAGIALTPILIEPTGSDMLLRLPFGGTDITARVQRDMAVRLGQKLQFDFNLANASVFCPVTQRRL
jgi:multiple sugar transport system ATP-binding protein